ncbi:MAG: hypothetical protein H5U07_04280 [Candidatus Aminicenantes bacterium]|nr:hypothetical protein [Candidatus Aminicenantes bacterium]
MNNKYKLIIALSLLVVFALGVIVGVLVDKNYQKKTKPKPAQRQEPFPTMEVLKKELQLTDEQEAQIKDIFKRSEERFEVFRKEVHARLKQLREQLKTEMDSVFTPEQQKKMQELMERYIRQQRRNTPPRREDKPQDQKEQNLKKKGE